jgi:2'-5' RNA ligase
MNSDEQARLGEFLKREGTMSLPDIPANQFTLYESVLTKTGAYYIPLEDYELQSENTPYPAT